MTLLAPEPDLLLPPNPGGLTIPGLPQDWTTASGQTVDLSVVPALPRSDLDTDLELAQEAWLIWGEQVLRYRLETWERTTQRIAGIDLADAQRLEVAKIRTYGAKYFTTIWCSIYEARRNQEGIVIGGDWTPFLLYPFQVGIFDFLEARSQSDDEDKNGWISKSRDMGATECCCKRALTRWLFDRPYSAKFISRHEELVDLRGDPDSIFERIASHLDPESEVCLPDFLLPKRWDFGHYRKERLIYRPDCQNTIRGSSSAQTSGRGGRAEEAYVDEGSFIRGLRFNVSALFMTCPHTYIVSSESIEVSEDFGDMVDQVKVENPTALLELDTHLQPFHTTDWKEKQRRAYKLAGREDAFEREVMRRRHAGLSDWIYPDARAIRPMASPRDTFGDGNKLVAGIDPGLAQDCAIGWFELDPVGPMDYCLDGYINHGLIPEYYAALLLGCDPDHQPNLRHDPDNPTSFKTMQEEYPTWRFEDRERLLMEWAAAHPQPTVYGDPFGGNSVTEKGEDWYTRMLVFSRKYNPRLHEDGYGRPLIIVKNWNMDARKHQTRHTALNGWLPRLQFAGTRGARQIHHAIASAKFQKANLSRIVEQQVPEHDDDSHPRTMAEYVAVGQVSARLAARTSKDGVDVVRSGQTRVRTESRTRTERTREIDPFAHPRS